MRTCSTLAALLVLNLCLSSSSVAGDEPAPSPGDVAEWIRSGEPEALDRAAAAGANLTAAQLREVLTEIRDQSRVHAVLRRKRIRGLTLDQVDLGQVASYLRTVSGVDFFVTPPAVERGIEDVVLHQGAEDWTLEHVLDAIVGARDLAWRVRGGVVMIGTVREFASPTDGDR